MTKIIKTVGLFICCYLDSTGSTQIATNKNGDKKHHLKKAMAYCIATQ